ncbi:MAG: ral stress protein CsbD [Acidobacteriaceae bacterium]|jgi:uncharacterized protein YjbJ (UPF0337 family)|nr:ral stress protein CsbD [Acidobacteriaceae bacterium]
MNWDRIQGKWKQIVGAVKARWGQLTDDDLNVIAGKRDQLIGRIQERYGIAKDEAQRQVELWLASLRDEDFAREADTEQKENANDSMFERKAS